MTSLPIPQIRTADPALVAGLREVDPTSELVYLGLTEAGAKWALMRLRPLNDERIRAATQILRDTLESSVKAGGIDERRWYARLRSYRMARLGYSVVDVWDFQGDPDARILQDYRWRAWRLRHDQPYDDLLAHEDKKRDDAHAKLSDPWLAAQMSRALRCPRTISF